MKHGLLWSGLAKLDEEGYGPEAGAELWMHVLRLQPTKLSDDEVEDAWWLARGQNREELAAGSWRWRRGRGSRW